MDQKLYTLDFCNTMVDIFNSTSFSASQTGHIPSSMSNVSKQKLSPAAKTTPRRKSIEKKEGKKKGGWGG